MQIPWPSVERVPTETEQDVNIFEFIFYLGRRHGGERQKTEKGKEDKEKEAPDRSGVKKNLDDRRGTKRKLHAGEDPPDDEDPKPGKIHYGGNFVTFEEFLEERTFLFIHHFSGRVDNLSKAVKEESEKLGLTVHTESIDIELGDDLTASEPYLNHLDYMPVRAEWMASTQASPAILFRSCVGDLPSTCQVLSGQSHTLTALMI